MSLLVNKFNVSKRIARASELGAVNEIYVMHEDMNGCENLKIHEKLAFENVNILR